MLAQGHTARKQQEWNSDLSCQPLEPMLVTRQSRRGQTIEWGTECRAVTVFSGAPSSPLPGTPSTLRTPKMLGEQEGRGQS